MILLATVTGGRGVLSAVSADGRFKQRLSASGGGVARTGLGSVHRMTKRSDSMRNIANRSRFRGQPDPRCLRHHDAGFIRAGRDARRQAAGAGADPAGQAGRCHGQARCNASQRAQGPEELLSQRSIYFDLDKFDVKDEYRAAGRGARQVPARQPRRAHADPGQHDERGSREYNVGLGQRRSEASRR